MASLLVAMDNRLIMRLSAQHGILTLKHPMHYMGIGHYADPKSMMQTDKEWGLLLVGAFAVSWLYFMSLSIGKVADFHARIFACLCLLAAAQLCAELSRGFISMPYSWLDIRLLMITACACAFGLLLLIYSSLNLVVKHAVHWIYAGVILTIIAVIFAPGFDAKTTAGVFVPLLVSLVQILTVWRQTKDKELRPWFVVQLVVAVIVLVKAASFHQMAHFVVIGALLCYLFARQARQQVQLVEEQKQIAKLEYKLSEKDQHQSPSKIQVSIGGNTEFLLASDITFCKAAGDYVELSLNDKSNKLFSGSLKQIEELLPSTFVKVHSSYLVNLDHVASLQSHSQGSSHSLQMDNLESVPVSRRMLPTVRQTLKSSYAD